jgi:hypothetical protein
MGDRLFSWIALLIRSKAILRTIAIVLKKAFRKPPRSWSRRDLDRPIRYPFLNVTTLAKTTSRRSVTHGNLHGSASYKNNLSAERHAQQSSWQHIMEQLSRWSITQWQLLGNATSWLELTHGFLHGTSKANSYRIGKVKQDWFTIKGQSCRKGRDVVVWNVLEY